MSTASKVVLGTACTISFGIIGYVHYKQKLDRFVKKLYLKYNSLIIPNNILNILLSFYLILTSLFAFDYIIVKKSTIKNELFQFFNTLKVVDFTDRRSWIIIKLISKHLTY